MCGCSRTRWILENSHDGAIGCMPMPHFKMDFAPPLRQREGEKEREREKRERMGRNRKEEEEYKEDKKK